MDNVDCCTCSQEFSSVKLYGSRCIETSKDSYDTLRHAKNHHLNYKTQFINNITKG